MILQTKGACDVNEILKDYIGKIRTGGHQAFRNVAMFPITSDEVIPFDYLTLDEALAKDLIEVVEIDEEGAVPWLRVVNRSDKMVLILDGEELVGAGTDLRLDSEKCTGFALSHEEGALHLSVFASDDGGKSRRPPRRR
jgi:hypothetical protein